MDSFEIESSKNSSIHFHDNVIEIEVIEKDDSGFDDYRAARCTFASAIPQMVPSC